MSLTIFINIHMRFLTLAQLTTCTLPPLLKSGQTVFLFQNVVQCSETNEKNYFPIFAIFSF